MHSFIVRCVLFVALALSGHAYRYDPQYAAYNLNTNQTAADPTDYWGEWIGHEYTPSPNNWRFPFYTLFLDRFVNGDPFNDNINGTLFEHDINSNQMRHGGDLEGLLDTLDYLQGMGIKGLYIAGSIFQNAPWGYDGYSPLDLSLLDPHYGDLVMWQTAINEIHARNMYVVLDNTFATLGDLIGFEGYLNETTPFTTQEHRALYKSDRQYLDFSFGNDYNTTCNYPRFWNETGYLVDQSVDQSLVGCYNSDFDQYGDTEAFGVYPDWRRQLTKFVSVQDRLREWHPPVRAKLENFYCMAIAQLDVDGFRYDKALQSTVDAMGYMNNAMRACAKRYGKDNFFLPGEITGGNTMASVYIGRGRQPDMIPKNLSVAINANLATQDYSIRDAEYSALDSAAFHYTVYRTLTRFLGMDGNLEAGYDAPLNWVDMWNTFIMTNDFTNANTGEFDPRHMYGVTNQDVFRWPAIKDGIHRQLLGHFVTIIQMPGIPLLLWGEEQSYYILDNTASNYIFGRQPISSASAWQTHGCYSLSSTQYYDFPVDSARYGCQNDSVGYDHRDPSAPVRNIIKHMLHLRTNFPVLNDGFWLQQLSNQTDQVFYPGSSGVATETGIWSVVRSAIPDGSQNFTGTGQGNTPVWLIYSNVNQSKTFEFNCSDTRTDPTTQALLSPFDAQTSVRNLFYPFDEINLQNSGEHLGLNGTDAPSGCLSSISLDAYGFRAYVPSDKWVAPALSITKFLLQGNPSLGHDGRIVSTVGPDGSESVQIELHFSQRMNCWDIANSIVINSTTLSGRSPTISNSSTQCGPVTDNYDAVLQGMIPSVWAFSARLDGVENGVHAITVKNVSNPEQNSFTNANDKFLFRIGQVDNPVVFPRQANYSTSLLREDESGTLFLTHTAAGADMWRYSTNWGSSFSYGWMPYHGGKTPITELEWSGTNKQGWSGSHVRVEYFSRLAGTSDIVQEGDLKASTPRRFPHLFLNGPYNEYGYDSGLENEMRQTSTGLWEYDFMAEWPTIAQINVWGLNPDGTPDQSYVLGDVDGDSILDRLPPSSLSSVVLNITMPPGKPYISWKITVDDGTLRFNLIPIGSIPIQITLYFLLFLLPLVMASIAVYSYMRGFYQVKFNEVGITEKTSFFSSALKRRSVITTTDEESGKVALRKSRISTFFSTMKRPSSLVISSASSKESEVRRTVLIATMEYDIEDWKIKVKIGGLGVMAQLMGKALGHQDLVWVVPCVGGVSYPKDTPAEPMKVIIMGVDYSVQVQYHKLNNITYVLLDAPVFRQQTQAEPYPARMDDLTSAIYYSAWNQCIAQAIRRFPVDLYHINDYHGTIAPLYLLPRMVPVCLSLHNAEFQGLWPMRTPQECHEVSNVFNLTSDVVQRFVQFGEVFNLLHAGASLLRVYQYGFGAVGVSKKYGRRAHLRYPIFWGLKKVGQLPNPDPTDTAAWDKKLPRKEDMLIDPEFEAQRPSLRMQAQEWAGLEQDPTAELFVFVGRWSMQKGIDLIADAFPSILKKNPKAQLICVGPVIDLYGKFAALKLEKLMKLYPKRVFSRPVFTALPPCIFSGAEFALIPSRDEPFGLVAVEFGRKGALGVGARVGGLGNMPGWWYTVEAVTTSHLLDQFKQAIDEAISSSHSMRATMRARAAKQRFPVAQWVEDLDILQSTSIRLFDKKMAELWVDSSHRKAPSTRMLGSPSRTELSPPQTPSDPGASLAEALRRLENSSDEDRISQDGISERMVDPSGAPTPNDPTSGQHRIDEVANELMLKRLYSHSNHSVRSSPAYPFSSNLLSTDSVVGEKNDFNLQQVDPFFTDSRGIYYDQFSRVLDKSSGMSEHDTCIEEYLMKSEKQWFQLFLKAKLGQEITRDTSEDSDSRPVSRRTFKAFFGWKSAPAPPYTAHPTVNAIEVSEDQSFTSSATSKEFALGETYITPQYLRKWLQYRIGDWPLYSYFLALGQIMAANSYQIILLTGQVGEAAERVYVICAIYLVSSLAFWNLYRRVPSATVLSIPFVFYGMAFFIIGIARFGTTELSRGWLMNVATGCYAIASASGSLFFALNFGDEGGSTVRTWILRACSIQGTQQIYVTALWFWGTYLNNQIAQGLTTSASYTPLSNSWKITAICTPIAIFLWVIGAVMYIALPPYYRQTPGRIPSFYGSIFRRKIILWFFVTVLIQNFFLSSQYGRSWSFLWSSSHLSYWVVACLVALFFIVVWAGLLFGFSFLSASHPWLLPLFAVGLGAPRWAQIWWGTSGMGLWMPWAGNYVVSAILSRCLWLWLGVLDTIQNVGIGMILLSTMTRVHVSFTLITAQVMGSFMTGLARGVAPNATGPGPIFPNIINSLSTMFQGWFWVGLVLNLSVCIGFFMFFRKEQLTKP